MTWDQLTLLAAAVLVIGFLYSSVGHAGASGYIAVMSMFSLDPAIIKPTALLLNIFVASITAWQFHRSGHFSWRLFWPFALLAVPLAFLGGSLQLPAYYFKKLVGLVLLFSAYRFLAHPPADDVAGAPGKPTALLTGGGLGLLAGLTGTGGGIFLTPILLFKHWARAQTAAAVSALFILLNSAAGLLGNWTTTRHIPSLGWILIAAAILGGSLGSYYGSRRFNHLIIKRMLAIVLLIAGLKLLFTG